MFITFDKDRQELLEVLGEAYHSLTFQTMVGGKILTAGEIADLHVKFAEIIFKYPEFVHLLNLCSVNEAMYKQHFENLLDEIPPAYMRTVAYLWGIRTKNGVGFTSPIDDETAPYYPESEGSRDMIVSRTEVAQSLNEHPFYSHNSKHALPYSYALALDVANNRIQEDEPNYIIIDDMVPFIGHHGGADD